MDWGKIVGIVCFAIWTLNAAQSEVHWRLRIISAFIAVLFGVWLYMG